MKDISKRLYLSSGICLILGWLILGYAALGFITGGVSEAQAAPAYQAPIYTPTPGPDGRIIYTVKEGDTLLSISLLTNVPLDELRTLNNLSLDTIYPGQKLLLGYAGPVEVTATAGPTPTPTPILPTPTPKPGLGDLCILLYNDLNGDSIRQEDEPSIPNGAISFGNRASTVSQTVKTGEGLEPSCFPKLPEGDYTISVAIPEGYNPTTNSSYEVKIGPGEKVYINFGAQANAETLAEAPTIPASGNQQSPILGIIGGFFLLAGIGLAIFAARMLRS